MPAIDTEFLVHQPGLRTNVLIRLSVADVIMISILTPAEELLSTTILQPADPVSSLFDYLKPWTAVSPIG